MPNNDKVGQLYKILKSDKKYANSIPDEETFRTKLQDEAFAEKFHGILKSDKKYTNVIPDLPTFSNQLGLKKKELSQELSQESGAGLQSPSGEKESRPVMSTIGAIDRGFYGLAPDLLDAFGVGVKFINNKIMAPLGIEEKVEAVEDTRAGKLANELRAKLNELAPVYEGDEGKVYTNVAEGVGQVLSLAASGGSAGLARSGTAIKDVPSATRVLVNNLTSRTSQLASAQMSGRGYKEAKSQGATDSEAFLQAFTEGLIGKTEALPIGKALERLNNLTGNRLGNMLINGFTGSVEEAAQETLQGYLSNLSAQNIYDETRELTDGLFEQAYTGGATGFIFNALLASVGVRKRGASKEELSELEKVEEYISDKKSQYDRAKEDLLNKLDETVDDSQRQDPGTPEQVADTDVKQELVSEDPGKKVNKEVVEEQTEEAKGVQTQKTQEEDTDTGRGGETDRGAVPEVAPKKKPEVKTEKPEQVQPEQAQDPVTEIASQYGYTTEKTDGGYKLFNRKGRHNASVVIKKGGYTITDPDGKTLLKGRGKLPQSVERVISEYFYGTKETKQPIQKSEPEQKTDQPVEGAQVVSYERDYEGNKYSDISSYEPTIPAKKVDETITDKDGNRVKIGDKRYETDDYRITIREERMQGSTPTFNLTVGEKLTDKQARERFNLGGSSTVIDEAGLTIDQVNERLGELVTPPPSEPNKVSEANKELPEKQRQFIENQLLPDESISDDIKQGLSRDAINYIPTTNKISNKEANAIIQAKGYEAALNDFKNEKNDLKGDVRVTLGNNLIKQLNKEAKNAKDDASKRRFLDLAIDTANTQAKLGTKAGQTLQAFNTYKALSPEGQLRVVEKSFEETRSKRLKRAEGEIQKLKQALEKAQKSAVDGALKSPKVQKKVKELSGASKAKAKAAREKAANDAIKWLESKKIDLKGKASDVTYALPASVWNGAISTMQASIKAGKAVADAVEDAISYIKKSHKGDWEEKKFRDDLGGNLNKYDVAVKIERGDIAGAIKGGLKDLGTSIDDIVRKHYTQSSKAKKSLNDRFVSELGLDGKEAKELADLIDSEFNRLATDSKRKQLDRLKPKEITRKKAKQLHEKIIEQSNLGALTDEQYRELYAEHMDLPQLKPEQAAKIMELAERAERAPEGFKKNEALQDLLNYQEKLKGIDWKDVGLSVWYANILSGLSTQTLNIQANFAETVGELFVSSIQTAIETKNLRSIGMLFSGLKRGYERGILDSSAAMRTGYSPERGFKTETPNVLERVGDTPFKFFGNWKWVQRFMAAADAFSYEGLKEMRYRQLALREALKQGKAPTRELHNRAINWLNETRAKVDVAKSQAQLEYEQEVQDINNSNISAKEKSNKLKEAKRNIKRRVFEIIEQQRGETAMEDARDFAARGTFNYDPEGRLGLAVKYINKFTDEFKPIKFIVPFTRIIANVANRYVEWSPYGFYRVYKGRIGGADKSTTRVLTQEDKTRIAIKAFTGTLAMAAMYALTDDEDGLFQITANGTDDYVKNYELEKGGWQPYSIKVGNTWISYQNTPLAIPLALIGNVRDMQKYKGVDGMDAWSTAAAETTLFISDMSFMTSLADFLSMFSQKNLGGIEDQIGNFLKRQVKGIVVPNLVSQAHRTYQELFDMPMKDARSTNWIKNIFMNTVRDIPVANDKMNNLYNALGEPVIPQQTKRFVPFMIRTPEESDNIWKLIIDNKAWIGYPRNVEIYDPASETERLMTDDEYNEYKRRAGELTRQRIEKDYHKILELESPSEVRDRINDIKTRARKRARFEMFAP